MATRPAARTTLNGTRRQPTLSHAKVVDAPEPDDDDGQPSPTPDDDVPAGPAPVDSLAEMLSSLQGATSSRITVYRVVKNQPQSYVFECDPASFSLDDLRDKHKGGEFRLYVTKDGRLFKNMRVVVEPGSPAQAQAPSQTAGLTDVLAVMRDGFSAQAAALREAMAVQRVSQPSPLSGMDIPQIITAIAAAITALRPAPAPPAPDNTSQALDMFMRGMEIASDRMGDGGGMGGLLRDALRSPILAQAVQAAIPQAPVAPQQPRLPQPQPQPNPPAPVSHAKPADPQPQPKQGNEVLAYYLGFLVGKAQGGADATLYAELVLDNVPDSQLSPMLARGDLLIDDLIAIHPPVAQHREWFVALLAEINELLSPEESAEGESEVVEQPGVAHAVDTTATVVPGQSAQ